MAKRTCSIAGCERPVRARGWCTSHYVRWQRHGDPLAGRPSRDLFKPGECIECRIIKPATEFYASNGKPKRTCKTCYLVACREYDYQSKYGLSVAEYDAMASGQSHRCLICGLKCQTGHRLAVDHCHKTGRVRGLLCRKCNSAIGYLSDDVDMLRRAIKYLTE